MNGLLTFFFSSFTSPETYKNKKMEINITIITFGAFGLMYIHVPMYFTSVHFCF